MAAADILEAGDRQMTVWLPIRATLLAFMIFCSALEDYQNVDERHRVSSFGGPK